MKKIKIIYRIWGILIYSMLIMSCEKEWLDVTSNTQIRAEDQFQTVDGYRDALIGSYINMTEAESYARNMTWGVVDVLSQQYEPLQFGSRFDEMQRFEYESANANPIIEGMWVQAYRNIANINLTLEYIETMDVLSAVERNLIKGELLGLRAFLHFDILRLFGLGDLAQRDLAGVVAPPYVTEYKYSVTPERTYQETFELLENDLMKAAELLESDPVYTGQTEPVDYGDINRDGFYDSREQRMNYYAVKALEARYLLWIGAYERARVTAEEVILESSFALVNTDSYNVSNEPLLYPELIFSLDVDALADLTTGFFDANAATDYDALFISTSRLNSIYETENSSIGLADARFNEMFNQQSRGYTSTKIDQTAAHSIDNQVPLIKLSEMYYIAAESYLEEDNITESVRLLNEVRNSRGIIEQLPDTLSENTVAEEIFKEYRKEFISEGQLFYFYKRMGYESIPEYSSEGNLGDEIFVLPYPDNEIEFGNR